MKRLLLGLLLGVAGNALASNWDYSEVEDPMGRGAFHIAGTESTNTVNFEFPYAGAQHAELLLRHSSVAGDAILLSIERGQLLCEIGGCSVLVRFDDDKPISFPASASADHDSTVLFIKNYGQFVAALKQSKRVRISPSVYREGNQVFEFDTSTFDDAQYSQGVKSEKSASGDFPKPTWCKKAKTKVEIMVCGDKDLSAAAIRLDANWDDYRKSYTKDRIEATRQKLKAWNKTLQACADRQCVDHAYDVLDAEVFAESVAPPPDGSDLPFVGSRSFNFTGANGVWMTISIDKDSSIKLMMSHVLEGVTTSDALYSGKYVNPIIDKDGMGYLIKGEKIYQTKNGVVEKNCDGNDKGNPCESDLY